MKFFLLVLVLLQGCSMSLKDKKYQIVELSKDGAFLKDGAEFELDIDEFYKNEDDGILIKAPKKSKLITQISINGEFAEGRITSETTFKRELFFYLQKEKNSKEYWDFKKYISKDGKNFDLLNSSVRIVVDSDIKQGFLKSEILINRK